MRQGGKSTGGERGGGGDRETQGGRKWEKLEKIRNIA